MSELTITLTPQENGVVKITVSDERAFAEWRRRTGLDITLTINHVADPVEDEADVPVIVEAP